MGYGGTTQPSLVRKNAAGNTEANRDPNCSASKTPLGSYRCEGVLYYQF